VAKVTRDTSPSGTRTARVTYRNKNDEVEIKDPNAVEKAMDATGDALSTAASKTTAGVKTGATEVADKAEDVGDATKKGVKKGATEAADKAEDVGDAAKKGASTAAKTAGGIGGAVKKGATEVGDKAEDVGDAVKKGAKKAGGAVKDVVTPEKKKP
jgi:hypothetical protein